MKNFKSKYRAFLLRKSRQVMRRRTAKNKLEKIQLSFLVLKRKKNPPPITIKRVSDWEDYDAPEVLDFSINADEVTSFVDGLHNLLGVGRKVRICFSALIVISNDALLYLLGQIQCLQVKYGRHRITGSYPESRKVEYLMAESGFFDLLRVVPRSIPGRKPLGRRFLRYKSDNKLAGNDLKSIRTDLFGDRFKMPDEVRRLVFRALSEAMANSYEHAYIDKPNLNKDIYRRWWFGAELNVRKNTFSFTFYDAGVGIPRTIRKTYNSDELQMVIGTFQPKGQAESDDASIIRASIAIGRTRTGLQERGRGLMDLHKVIDALGAGTLSIYSRHGKYSYNSRQTTVGATVQKVEGTLISWQIPFDKTSDVQPELFNDMVEVEYE